MLVNLIKNSLKFTPRHGKITVKFSYDDECERIIVHVRDSGVGISEQDFPKLFTRFGKLQRTIQMTG